MTDDRETVPETPRARGVSRQEAKRIRNLNTVAINRMTDGRDRAYQQMAEELQHEREQRARVFALLEAVVRRHGRQVFSFEAVAKQCARGRVRIDASPQTGRITVELIEDLEIVSSDDESDRGGVDIA